MVFHDCSVTPDALNKMVTGADGVESQVWAITRCIDNLGYYALVKYIPVAFIYSNWQEIKKRMRFKDRIPCFEFLFQLCREKGVL